MLQRLCVQHALYSGLLSHYLVEYQQKPSSVIGRHSELLLSTIINQNVAINFFAICYKLLCSAYQPCMHGYLFGGEMQPYTALLRTARLLISGNAAYTFLFGSLFIILCIFFASLPVFSVVIQDFLSFGYCDALKYGLARTVKVFRNGARQCLFQDLKTASHFFPTTAHVRTVCRNARRTAMRGAHQFDCHNTCQTLKTAAEHHIQTTV